MNYHVTLEIRYYDDTQQIEICMSQTEVTIKKAKGRPMLTWVGKKPLTRVRAYPAQAVESFTEETLPVAEDVDWSQWPDSSPQGGLLFHGDNKDVLAHLLANGFRNKVKLIYIDPPFDSGADYVRKVELRGAKGTTKLDGEEYTLGEQIQYTDIWDNDNYLQFMYERLQMLKDLLADDGVICLHCDDKKSHHLRCLLDEVFGSENFRNEVIWHFPGRSMHNKARFNRKHNHVFIYSKSKSFELVEASEPWDRDEFIKVKKQAVFKEDDGREYIWQDESGGGSRGYKRYLEDVFAAGKALDDVWRLSIETSSDKRRTDYPTQKPESLMERIIKACSKNGDLVLDCFLGSGTTMAVAQKLGRRWIGCDINKGSIQTSSKRLQAIIQQQAEAAQKQELDTTQGSLLPETTPAENNKPKPAQNSFYVNRVNDYDLQIQHNEAVDLVSDHLGITRNRTDSDFDGTLGNKLVKIIPFNHPLSPPDIEEVKRVLSSRPEEERNIVMVCLGTEIAARAVIEQHNKNRPINKLEIIELRTHPKYGGIIKHEPLSAEISVKKEGQELIITIEDVLSPSILQRLNKDEGLFRAQITDWRAQVDTVLIDTNYSGEVFNIIHSDVPERKKDMVLGEYCVPLPAEGAVIAVKIIDMLGEEVICVETLSK